MALRISRANLQLLQALEKAQTVAQFIYSKSLQVEFGQREEQFSRYLALSEHLFVLAKSYLHYHRTILL